MLASSPVADWYLSFSGTPITLAAAEQLLSSSCGTVSAELGDSDGNPHDGYYQPVSIIGQRDDVRLVLHTTLSLSSSSDPSGITGSCNVVVQAPSPASKRAAWRLLADAFATIGWTDYTLISNPAAIVDDAEAAGELETAARLRADITRALVAFAAQSAHVVLQSPRCDDLEAVLAAYRNPEHIVTVALGDCGLRTLPTNLARFPNIESLSVAERLLDGAILRGLSLPKLARLRLEGGFQRVTRADVLGFPALEILDLRNSALEDLDPEIAGVCPRLTRVDIEDTPLFRDARKLAVLRARWPQIT
jgi:hypothetical protein